MNSSNSAARFDDLIESFYAKEKQRLKAMKYTTNGNAKNHVKKTRGKGCLDEVIRKQE